MTDKDYFEQNKEIFKQFKQSEDATRDLREQCLEDRKFVGIAGGMWGDKFLQDFNSPKVEINKAHLSIVRIINEFRNNRITVDFHNKLGEKIDIASTLDGLYRATEQHSNAEEAYDNCFNEGISGGFGALRLITDYTENDIDDDDDAEQIIKIEPIYDADFSVYFDSMAKKQDKSDANFCFLISEISKTEFEQEYGDEKIADFKFYKPFSGAFDWGNDLKDTVKIAEYYEIEKVKNDFEIYSQSKEFEFLNISRDTKIVNKNDENYSELVDNLKLRGWQKTKEYSKKIQKVKKYIISGCGIAKDCGYIAGKFLPIIPFYAKYARIGGKEYYNGHVRFVKDLLRIYNLNYSMLAKFSSLSQQEMPIFHVDQMNGLQDQWADRATKDYAYLLVNSIENANGQTNVVMGPLGYTKPMDLPPIVATLMQQCNADISEMLGNQEQGDKVASNISAEAIETVQERLEKQAYIYMTNFSKTLRRLGKVWLSMAQEIYVEDNREVKTIDISGNASKAILNKNVIDKGIVNDISNADLDVVVNIGASSTTKAQKNNKKLISLLPFIQDPETMQNITDLLIMNMDFEGQENIKKYYRKRLVQKGVIEPNDGEKQALLEQQKTPPQPDPQSAYLLASAEKIKADMQKIASEVELNYAKIGLTKSDIIKTLQEAGQQGMTSELIQDRQQPPPMQQPQENNSLQTQ